MEYIFLYMSFKTLSLTSLYTLLISREKKLNKLNFSSVSFQIISKFKNSKTQANEILLYNNNPYNPLVS